MSSNLIRTTIYSYNPTGRDDKLKIYTVWVRIPLGVHLEGRIGVLSNLENCYNVISRCGSSTLPPSANIIQRGD